MREDVRDVISEIEAVDRKAAKGLRNNKDLDRVLDSLPLTTSIIWIQFGMYIADSNGQMDNTNIHSVFAILTPERLLFLGNSASAEWSYEDLGGVSDGKQFGGVWKVRISHRNGSAIWFASSHMKAGGTFVGTLAALIRDAGNRPAPSATDTAGSGSASIADELEKLARLRDQGVLNEDEFEVAKTRLLTS